ncbi:MAG: F0F1 ATP synthase subunit A [Polyangiaceae bacterium]|nr:F0F1 ATP synthase subunit A [Polyangiaceae bacterium]
MPKHTYWFTYLLDMFPALKSNVHNMGKSFFGEEPGYRSAEPVLTSMLYMAILLVLAIIVRKRIKNVREAAVPSDKLTLVTFFEVFVGYFYDLAKGVMGPDRAKKYFPIIGAASLFIIFSNLIGMIPGFSSPTSSLNVTFGCALVVLATFNYYGLKANGWAYIAHYAGPKWYLAPLVFPIEILSSIIIRPVVLAVRLMVNIAVDHLLASIFLALVTLFVPIPIMFLGLIVCVVQTIVFCLLTAVYIGLATEPHEHEGHGHGHGEGAHAH